jgi:DNA-binding CsgD family transcriptional regulator
MATLTGGLRVWLVRPDGDPGDCSKDDRPVTESNPKASDSSDRINLAPLSQREREILAAAIEGVTAREIASRFSLSEATVRSHLSSIYAKAGVSGRLELLACLSRRPDRSGPVDRTVDGSREGGRNPTGGRPRRWAAVVILVVIIGVALAAFLAVRPDLPSRADLATVSRLMASGQVTDLSLVGERLIVTTIDGHRLRAEGVSESQAEALWAAGVQQIQRQPDRRIAISRGGLDETSQLAIAVSTLVLPVSALVIAGFLVRTGWRRQPPVRPVG